MGGDIDPPDYNRVVNGSSAARRPAAVTSRPRPGAGVLGAVLGAVVAFAPVPESAAQAAATPSDAQAFHQRATRALARGDRDAAEALAAGRAPSDPAGEALRARLLLDRGRYEEAEALLAPVARAAPGSAAGLELGRLLVTLGRADEAAPFLEAVIINGMNGPDGLAQYRAGLAERAAGGFQRANALLRSAARLLPDDPAVQTAWGDLFLEKYQNADAAQSYQDALALDDEWAPALYGMARVLENENPPSARGAAEAALTIDPEHAAAHLFIAGLELGDRNRDAARAAIDKALAVNPAQPGGARAAGGHRLPGRSDRRLRCRGRAGPGHQPGLRRRLPDRRPGRRRRRTGSRRRWRSPGGRLRSSRRTPAPTPIWGCTCCGPATSRRRVQRWNGRSPGIPSMW